MNNRLIRYIKPGKLFDSIASFNSRYAATRGEFSIDVQCLKKDMEWNQMDQLHRQFIHNTYQENLRIALGRDFSISLTRWGKWPFLITVADTRVDEGLYYQDFVLAGVLFIHNIISMEDKGNDITQLKLEWIINSHRFLKPLHGILGRMFYKLSARLQQEDAVIREQRYRLRQKGYNFLSDPPDFYNSNMLTNNTIYPPLPEPASIQLDSLPMQQLTKCSVNNVDFLVKREEQGAIIWPAACPHEGGDLAGGKLHENCKLECPWHGLKFIGSQLDNTKPTAEAYGFSYTLAGNTIHILQKKTS